MRIQKTAIFFLLSLAVYLPTASVSQQDTTRTTRSERRDSAYHLSAGRSSLRQIDGERVIMHEDGVVITHGNVRVTCRRARHHTRQQVTVLLGEVNIDRADLHMEGDEGEYHRFEDKVILRGNVKILDAGWVIHCDEATFFRTRDVAWLKGNVVAVDSATTLKADSLFYDRQSLTAEVFGNVAIENEGEGIRVEGEHGFYYRDRTEGVIDRLPHLLVDPDSAEPTSVVADTMRFFPDDNRAIAAGRVKIVKGHTITQCDSAVLIDDEQLIELYGNPLAKKDNVSMQSNRMVLHYNEDEIDRIALVGQANVTETATDPLVVGRDSWVKGDSMILFVRDNRLDSIRVSGHAESDYYPRSQDRVERNSAEGDRMFFVFAKDSLKFVSIVGNADGVYRYLDLARNETADSLRWAADTSLVYVPFEENSKTVAYAADSVEYYARERDMVLESKAKVVYDRRTLLGDHITYNADLQLLDATGSPILIEEPDKFYGTRMNYDLDTGVGLVQEGSTKFLDGYYSGDKIAKVGDDVLKVWNSSYTTCDRKVPHYHFKSKQMKVYLNDKVVSGPIFLYIGETPIAFLPFFSQNIRRGRRSGILRPDFEFGITSAGTRFIRDVGYYWATNEYTDFLFSGDFNERESLRFRINNRYKLRYVFNGRVDYSHVRNLRTPGTQWTFSSNHDQNLGERFSVNSNLRFVSSDQAPRAVSNLDDVANVIDRRIESRLSVRKAWDTVGFSASARRVENLDITDPGATKVSTTLPNISLSIPSRSLYFGERTRHGDKPFMESLLDGIRFSPGVSFNRDTRERINDRTETITSNQSLNFSSPRKIGFINISPNFSMSNRYTRTVTEVDQHLEINNTAIPPDTTLIPASRDEETDNVFRWATGARIGTNVYGTFFPSIGALRGIRHTFSPTASYSFQPSVGGRPSTQRFTISISNAIDLKMRGKDEETDRKLSGVLIWALSSSYNPDAPSRRGWSDVSSRVNTRLLGTSLSLNQIIDPYQLEIKNTSVTSSLGLRGTHSFGSVKEATTAELNVAASDTTDRALDLESKAPEDQQEEAKRPERKGLPWGVSGSFSYSKSQFGDPRSTLNANGNISLTDNWRITYSTTYDVERRDLLGQNFSIHRSLHCWEMSFTRQKLGDEWEFYFRINIIAQPEIYVEKGQRGLGGSGGFTSPF
ncbi:MAG: putative LPS assembly protein LptD [Candidatus Krumholzibacteria bacterium]